VLIVKATKRIPKDMHNVTYYSANDLWMYVESEHPNMCEECHSYNLDFYAGTDLRTLFEYHEILDQNFIAVNVHPNCQCKLVRVLTSEESEFSLIEEE